MELPEVLLNDLLHAAGPLVTHGLNVLPVAARRTVADAVERGGRVELRIAPPADVRVVLVDGDGYAVDLVSSQSSPTGQY